MGGFTREELAQRADVPVDHIDRLVKLRIVSSGEGNSPERLQVDRVVRCE